MKQNETKCIHLTFFFCKPESLVNFAINKLVHYDVSNLLAIMKTSKIMNNRIFFYDFQFEKLLQ